MVFSPLFVLPILEIEYPIYQQLKVSNYGENLFTLFLGLTLAFCVSAQSLVINPNDVQFWTGTGSNSTVVAIAWDDNSAPYTPTVVIWGVRWDGSIYLINALDTMPRMTGVSLTQRTTLIYRHLRLMILTMGLS